MADIDQEQDQEPYQLTGDDLAELHTVAQHLQTRGDPRADKLWDVIAAQSGGGDGTGGPGFRVLPSPPATSWVDDLENTLWGGSGSNHGVQSMESRDNSGRDSVAALPVADKVPGDAARAEGGTAQDLQEVKPAQTGAGPIESNPAAWNAFMQGLDSHKVGDYTVGELANVLTNESRDLSFVGPSMSLFDNDLDHAKYVQAHAIINNAMQKDPNSMANRTVTEAAAASPGHERDVAIMRQAYLDRMTRNADPAQGRTYFGNSAQVLKSRPIGNSRQTPFARFGPFALGSQPPKYIYIYNDPIKK
jgi:hypothetical protein